MIIYTRVSYLAARPSLEPRPLQVFIHFFFFLHDRPTHPTIRDGVMGNETFYWDGLSLEKKNMWLVGFDEG